MPRLFQQVIGSSCCGSPSVPSPNGYGIFVVQSIALLINWPHAKLLGFIKTCENKKITLLPNSKSESTVNHFYELLCPSYSRSISSSFAQQNSASPKSPAYKATRIIPPKTCFYFLPRKPHAKMPSNRKLDIQFLLNNNAAHDDRAHEEHAMRNVRRSADGNHSPRLGAGSSRYPGRPSSANNAPRHASNHSMNSGPYMPYYNGQHGPQTDQVRHSGRVEQHPTTRKKMADPSRLSMDPEAAKRKYVCQYHGCGCRFKQKGGMCLFILFPSSPHPHLESSLTHSSSSQWNFCSYADLKKHVRVVHHNERNFICSFCSKGFGEKGYVTVPLAFTSAEYSIRKF